MESPASRRGWVVGAERVILTLAHPELPHFKRMEEIIWIYLTFLRCQSVRSYPETMLRIQIHIITMYHFLETTKKAKNVYLWQHVLIDTILTIDNANGRASCGSSREQCSFSPFVVR